MQHDVHVSRNGANYNNLINVQSNKWDLPTIINTNIRGALASKIDEIKVIKDNYGMDVLAITEIWCTSSIPDGSLSLPGFNLYRRDRQDGRQHGGIVCYIRDTIPTKQWTELNQPELETMWMTIRPPKMPRNHPQITICTVYHPPGADDWTLLNHIDQSVDYVRRHHPYTDVIIIGDLNKFRDSHLKRNHNLKQIVDIPTRGTATLDKIYTNLTDLYHRPVVIAPIGLSDHMVVICTPSTSTKYTEPVVSKTSLHSCRPDDRARFAAALNLISWETLFHLPSCEQQLQFFNSTIRTLLDMHLPERKIRRCSSDRPWIDDNFRYLIRHRQIALLSENQPLYRHYRNKVNRARKSLQRKYYQRKIKSLENEHPKRWWNSEKELVLVHCSGNFSILANEISDFFESVTKDFPPLLSIDEFLPPGADTAVPDAYIINVDEVAISLSRIKTNKATGPDEIPNWILHDYATILAPPACAIFNSSLREGTMPALWKCADVRPVPKIRPPALIEKDLRPISLTPVLSKCLEKFMCTWIMDITMDQIDPQQYGSIKGTSTVHALVELVHKWKHAVETPGTIVRILLVDFSKAFDQVNRHILITKCASLGLPTFITKWLTSFLCQRKQRVKIGSVKSEYTAVNAGVPQGTISINRLPTQY